VILIPFSRDIVDALIASLVGQKVLVEGEWAKGHSKIFLRTQTVN